MVNPPPGEGATKVMAERPDRPAKAAHELGRMPGQPEAVAPIYAQLADVLLQLGRLREVEGSNPAIA